MIVLIFAWIFHEQFILLPPNLVIFIRENTVTLKVVASSCPLGCDLIHFDAMFAYMTSDELIAWGNP